MTFRTSLSLASENMQEAIVNTANIHFFGNVSTYIQELIIKDQIERGLTREHLMEGAGSVKRRNIRTKQIKE